MRAIQLIEIGQPVEMRTLDVPTPGARDVLVQVRAAGICHSDAHYRAGTSPTDPPVTLGHEVAGVVAQVGDAVTNVRPGDRVGLHYLVTCGECHYCTLGSEQFCVNGQMIGKHRDGGYAEYVRIPARSVVRLPDEIPFEHGAIMMCSSATSFHALRKSRLQAGERAAIFGVGGLGMSAVQLARAFGALDVYAVDINPDKLALAERLGAIPVDASVVDPVAEIRRLTGGRGVDVALELIGLPEVSRQALQSVDVFGRVVLVGLSDRLLAVDPYREILGKEAEIIGASDHLISEFPLLFEYACRGALDLSDIVTRTVPLEAGAVNQVMDELDAYGGGVRTVITPAA
ncbi:MAG TPA: alcohol dehydrogenase [Chloroflexi bacterium]|nr:alcohol dehydrogenase [Chloroflexota bacterium]